MFCCDLLENVLSATSPFLKWLRRCRLLDALHTCAVACCINAGGPIRPPRRHNMHQEDSNHGSLSHVFKSLKFLRFIPTLVICPRLVLITQGIESQPGPLAEHDDTFVFEFINPSGVAGEHSTTAHDLAKRDAHCIFFAEHLATQAQLAEFKSTLKASSWTAQASVLDPEKGHQSAGVGGMVRNPFRIFDIEPTTPALKSLLNSPFCLDSC